MKEFLIDEFGSRPKNPDDNWLYAEPWPPEKMKKYREALQLMAGVVAPAEYTCDNCGLLGVCGLAFDFYNTNGDCLYDK